MIVHAGPYHTQFAQMLPHFTESAPHDINEHFGFNKVGDKDEFEITFETNEKRRPKELAHLDVNKNPDD